MAKYTVVHPALFMAGAGDVQPIPVGTELKNLTEKQILKLGKKIALVGTTKTVEVDTKTASK